MQPSNPTTVGCISSFFLSIYIHLPSEVEDKIKEKRVDSNEMYGTHPGFTNKEILIFSIELISNVNKRRRAYWRGRSSLQNNDDRSGSARWWLLLLADGFRLAKILFFRISFLSLSIAYFVPFFSSTERKLEAALW